CFHPDLYCHSLAFFTFVTQTLPEIIMKHLLQSKVGRLRIIGLLEGISLLALVFVAVPLKHMLGNPALVKMLGPLHGALFLLFVFNALGVGVEQSWKFRVTTWKVLLACMIPFGTFYIDRKILSRIDTADGKGQKG